MIAEPFFIWNLKSINFRSNSWWRVIDISQRRSDNKYSNFNWIFSRLCKTSYTIQFNAIGRRLNTSKRIRIPIKPLASAELSDGCPRSAQQYLHTCVGNVNPRVRPGTQVHPGSSPICSICNLGVVENISHFLLSCPVLLPNRVQFKFEDCFLVAQLLWLPWSYPFVYFLFGWRGSFEIPSRQSFVFSPCLSHVDSGTFTFQCGVNCFVAGS